MLRDVHVRRIERDMVLRHELVVGHDAFLREIGEDARFRLSRPTRRGLARPTT